MSRRPESDAKTKWDDDKSPKSPTTDAIVSTDEKKKREKRLELRNQG
jgi:hypothetical protein